MRAWTTVFLAAVATVSIAGTVQAQTALGSGLVQLGQQMQLSAAQQTQWQQVLNDAKAARLQFIHSAQKRLTSVIAALQQPDVDIAALAAQQDSDRATEQAARKQVRDELLAFYASATPEQQAQMRAFLSTRLQRLQRLLAWRSSVVGDGF